MANRFSPDNDVGERMKSLSFFPVFDTRWTKVIGTHKFLRVTILFATDLRGSTNYDRVAVIFATSGEHARRNLRELITE